LYDLFDHLVGARRQSWWHGEVLHLGDLKIDVQRELGRLFDRDVDRLRSTQILASTNSASWTDQYLATIGIGPLNS
jgi:hypothetical protein